MEKTATHDDLDLEQQQVINWNGVPMYLHQGFWCPNFIFEPMLSFRKNFTPHDSDIVLASQPKAGTTWTKALLFSIVNRHRFPSHQSPLLTTNSHKLVRSLECYQYRFPDLSDLENMAPPCLLATHLPHQLLPDSIFSSKCKIIYVTRNPLDQFISEREFGLKVRMRPDLEPLGIEESFDMFCRGVHGLGPFWDHILGYWKASLENPDRILFLKYEEMKTDPIACVDKIADFVGLPFSDAERERGYIDEISNLCSFENLMNLDVNKKGHHHTTINNSFYYRKGEIGDWKNHLTSAMAERLKKIMDEKMGGYGLNLDTFFNF